MPSLTLYCDGSGARDRWGTGVVAKSENIDQGYVRGGLNSSLPPGMQEKDGRCDSSVAEALALYHACDVACDVPCDVARTMHLEIIVDRTASIMNMMKGHVTRSTLTEALSLVRQGLLRTLARFEHLQIDIVHKNEHGLTHGWQPHALANHGRQTRTDSIIRPAMVQEAALVFMKPQLNQHGCLMRVTIALPGQDRSKWVSDSSHLSGQCGHTRSPAPRSHPLPTPPPLECAVCGGSPSQEAKCSECLAPLCSRCQWNQEVCCSPYRDDPIDFLYQGDDTDR